MVYGIVNLRFCWTLCNDNMGGRTTSLFFYDGSTSRKLLQKSRFIVQYLLFGLQLQSHLTFVGARYYRC